jgi:hypothetical protein
MKPLYDIKYNHMPGRIRWGAVLGRDTWSKAGKARMASMTDEEKSAHQSMAAKARWKKQKERQNELLRQS